MPENLWKPAEVPSEDQPLDLVVYRSRLIGADPTLVVWGGGNTSVKTIETDFRGRQREVMWIKGSGTDLKTIDRSGFAGVFRDDVLPLLEQTEMSDEEMVAYLGHCLVEPGGRRPSIETLLHGFLPAKHVDHSHADAIVALTNTEHGHEAVRAALGEQVAYVPYRRPGFALSKEVYEAAQRTEAVVLANHGLVTWGETAEESYATHIELVARAEAYLTTRIHSRSVRPPVESAGSGGPVPSERLELLLKVRGMLGWVVLHVADGPEYRAVADRPDIQELARTGPATPDHILRLGLWPCVLPDGDIAAALEQYERDYHYFLETHGDLQHDWQDPRPHVFVVPGLGLVAAGRDIRAARISVEVALHTLEIAVSGMDAHGTYTSLSPQDLYDVYTWPLERYKQTLAPPPKELAGRVVLVTGAASGIGRAVARHLASLGAQTVLLDLNEAGLAETAGWIVKQGDLEPLSLTLDLCDGEAVSRAIRRTVETFGGFDALVSNAGIAAAGALTELDPDLWRRSLEVNATSHFLITAEVMKALQTQGRGGSLVYIASKNAFSPGAGFGAYSAAKAAQLQLARIAALEGGSYGIRANIINPDAIFEDSGLWTDELRQERAAIHGVPVEKLEDFYAQRNLLKTKISGQAVAEAVAFLISSRSHATTGTVITVDGGVPGAFPR
jgi:rhamnulose-1-phosphate aldolase/alcohol dehydrogenase